MRTLIKNLLAFLIRMFSSEQIEEAPEKIVKTKMYVVNSFGFRVLIMDRGFDLVQNPLPGYDTLKGTECYAKIHKTKGNQFFFIGTGRYLYVKEGDKPGTIKYIALYPVITEKDLDRVVNDLIPIRDWKTALKAS